MWEIVMEFLDFFYENIWLQRIIYSIIAIVAAIVIYELFTKFFLIKFSGDKKGKKYNTYIKLFKSLTRYVFIITLIFVLLKINGVNITSIVTGVGVAGIIFGFAIQDSLKDIIKGLDIITDSYYHVGDVIKVEGYTGVVLAIGLKTTRLEDIYQNNIVSISNRNIEKVEILSHLICIEVPLPYELKVSEANALMEEVVGNIRKIGKVEKADYAGVNDFADSSIKHLIKINCAPVDRLQTRRNALSCIMKCLEEKGVSIPFNQLDIHQK